MPVIALCSNRRPAFLSCATPHNSRVSARLSHAEAKSDAKPTDSGGGGLSSGVIAIIGICAVVGIVGVAVAAWAFLRASHPGEIANPETSETDQGIGMSSAVPVSSSEFTCLHTL